VGVDTIGTISTPSKGGTSPTKLIISILVAIILIALVGRAIWAYQAVEANEAKAKSVQVYTTTTTTPISVNHEQTLPGTYDETGFGSTGGRGGALPTPPDAFVVTVDSSAATNTTQPVSVDSDAPSATITVNGVTNLNIKYTGWYDFVWNSTNANSFSSIESLAGCADPAFNSPAMSSIVGQGSSGSMSIPITPKHTGCTITYTFTVKKVETGQKASASAVLIVE